MTIIDNAMLWRQFEKAVNKTCEEIDENKR